jgi:hypothetical protein
MTVMKPVVFIHTNDKQLIGAKVAEYSLKANSRNPDGFDVRIVRLEQTPHLLKREGQSYLRKGRNAIWHNDDLQSFSPLRMMIPQLMNYKGMALVIDPDVFAVADVSELLKIDMYGKSIFCRNISNGYKGNGNGFYATSVMLLDCEKLKHWNWDDQIDQMFNHKLDYGDWISLRLENKDTIGLLDEEWNHFDILNEKTKLLHNTERSTQPWKTGLPVDYDTNWSSKSSINNFLRIILDKLKIVGPKSEYYYQKHPDKNQEIFFLKLLKECLRHEIISYELLNSHVKQKNVRSDIFKLLEGV